MQTSYKSTSPVLSAPVRRSLISVAWELTPGGWLHYGQCLLFAMALLTLGFKTDLGGSDLKWTTTETHSLKPLAKVIWNASDHRYFVVWALTHPDASLDKEVMEPEHKWAPQRRMIDAGVNGVECVSAVRLRSDRPGRVSKPSVNRTFDLFRGSAQSSLDLWQQDDISLQMIGHKK